MTLNDHQRSFFQDNGFLVVKNVIDPEFIRGLFMTTAQTFVKYRRSEDRQPSYESWVDPSFNRDMIRLRREDPQTFSAVFDAVQTSSTMYALAANTTTLAIAAQLTREEPYMLSQSGKMLRMDPPSDKRNSLEWHQESSYYFQNLVGEHGAICWMPMHVMTSESGSIFICPQSHREGALSFETEGKKDYITSAQKKVPRQSLDRYEPLQVQAEDGDAVFMNMDLFHKSGDNVSNAFRFSYNIRYHRMSTDDFLPGRDEYRPNSHMLEKRNKRITV